MAIYSKVILFLLIIIYIKKSFSADTDLPTLYEYYTKGGIKSGLEAEGDYFKLNGKQLRILSGSFHYFRVLPEQWKDRLLKMKAVGLNTVQFYSPWNLHEEYPNQFNFKYELDLDKFLTEIKQTDMLVMYRPGPYICGEWENGGIPAWLLRDPNLKIRTAYDPYLNATANYFKKLAPIIKKHLFQNGGPIIGIQLENEFAAFGNTKANPLDHKYMQFLKDTLIKDGINSLFYTCDNAFKDHKDTGSLNGTLMTANFVTDVAAHLNGLKKLQPNRPQHVSEYWSGWYSRWKGKHEVRDSAGYQRFLEQIVLQFNASVNFYMFLGGTNFGFMSSEGVETSYDYDAPLTEDGQYQDKYYKTKQTIEKLENQGKIPKLKKPSPPKLESKANYGLVNITQCLSFEDLLAKINPISSAKPLQMELINLNGKNYGQNFGFINYRAKVSKFKQLKFEKFPNDRTIVMVDGNFVKLIDFRDQDFIKNHMTVNASDTVFHSNGSQHTLDILVENMGREDHAGGKSPLNHRKGINGKIFIDNHDLTNWKIYPLEFKKDFVKNLSDAHWKSCKSNLVPSIHKGTLIIKDKPKDTFLKFDHWTKGNIFVNGFNVGRYWNVGPQKTLYIPWPLLNTGNNHVYLFEIEKGFKTIQFTDKPNLG